MNEHKEISIPSRNWMFVLVLIFALLIAYNLIEDLYIRIDEKGITSPLSLFKLLVNSSITLFFLLLSWYAIRRMFDQRPGLIITPTYITDNAGLVPVGTINWDEVESISHGKTFMSECISIKVKYPLKYIRNERNFIKRWLLKRNYDQLGTPVNITVAGLKIKYKALFEIMQQYFVTVKVETRTHELKREKDIILQEKQSLIDSINYAKRIQTALLPSQSTIQKLLGENFILFLPKDIVSGDFYWVEKVNDLIFFAVCDCTGHGVPGALISIVCHNALNRSVKEYNLTEPAQILDTVSTLVAETLGQDGEVKDGMDISFCSFNTVTRQLIWAGANLPLWIARQNAFYELIEYKPDKQPIGLHYNKKAFNQHYIDIIKGDTLYLFSDGYADQFGGPKGKKLTRKKFKELLLQQRSLSLQLQQQNLLQHHLNYKGSSSHLLGYYY